MDEQRLIDTNIDKNHIDIINEYEKRIENAYAEIDLRSVAIALLAHLAYLLGRESVTKEEKKGPVLRDCKGSEINGTDNGM